MSASVVVPIVNQIVQPMSVLDVGCGLGGWLAEWIGQGVADVVGVDGEHVDTAQMLIDGSHFHRANLQTPLSLGRRFDLVESLEVAEHLDSYSADEFVRSLTRHADTVLFSAAIPGQRGYHHVNEQWPSYWVSRFAQEGFRLYDAVRPLIWSDSRVETWYRQNTLLFSKVRTFGSDRSLTDIVHPQMWEDRLEPGSFTLRELMKGLPIAAKSAARSLGGRALARVGRS
jgi:cyclopropane fatty-acyl-phospholipid synthase-like methyltransferase